MQVGDRIALLTATGVLAGVVVAAGALTPHSLSGIHTRIDELEATLRQSIEEGDGSVRQEAADLRQSVGQEIAALRRAIRGGDESSRRQYREVQGS